MEGVSQSHLFVADPHPLKGLDYSVVQQCMHCGMCLPTCPTYAATRKERHSPRGRIALMRAVADGDLAVTRTFADEMYFCLGCLACVTACPAGVNYAELFEHARAAVEHDRALSGQRRRWLRAVLVRWLFMEPRRLRRIGRLIRLYQRSGAQAFSRRSGLLRLLPRRLRELESQTPTVMRQFSCDVIAPVSHPEGKRRFRVAVLTGCVQDLIASDVNRDTVEVLCQNGCEVRTPPAQPCCGSLHAHLGEMDSARTLARRMITQFPPAEYDAIISNAGGCGSHLKHFGPLLAGDADYAEAGREWDRKIKDIHEWLVEINFRPPTSGIAGSDLITYHESCHLSHGQGIAAAPRAILQSIPEMRFVELPESQWCCGSAGVYNLLQPAMADWLLQRKLRHVQATGANVVATANPGCWLQLTNGLNEKNSTIHVVHPISLLAKAYREEKRRMK